MKKITKTHTYREREKRSSKWSHQWLQWTPSRCLISRSLATHTTTEPFVTLSRCPPSVCPLWPSKKRKKLKKKQSNTLGEKEDLLLLLLLLLRLGLLPLLLPLFPRTSMLPLVVGFFIGFPKKKEKKRKEKESSDPGMTRNDSTRGRMKKKKKRRRRRRDECDALRWKRSTRKWDSSIHFGRFWWTSLSLC